MSSLWLFCFCLSVFLFVCFWCASSVVFLGNVYRIVTIGILCPKHGSMCCYIWLLAELLEFQGKIPFLFFLRILKALLNFLLVPTFLFMTLKRSQFLTSYEHGELFLCKPAWPCFCFCSSEVVFSGLGFCWSGTTCRHFTQSPTLLLFFVVLFLFSFAIINDLKQQKGR